MKKTFRLIFVCALLLFSVVILGSCDITDPSGGNSNSVTVIEDGTYTRPDEIVKEFFGGYTTTAFPSFGKTIVISGKNLSLATVTGNNYTEYTYTLKNEVITRRTASGTLVEEESKNTQVAGGKATITQKFFYREGRIEIEYKIIYTESTNETTHPVGGGYTCLIVYAK
ncbi:MAG: hypothetical protein LBV51_00095 [Acholeplasmatales bacterium]|jgi:hypothetical protein|nr:hypothetical protein [Acholeplasmatales bacterium]